MSFASVLEDIDAINQARAQAETFGHLAPETGKTYTGTILFAHSGYGGKSVPIQAEFADLPDSPWFYEGMCDFLLEHYSDETVGKVFRWTGTYEFSNWDAVYSEDENDIVRDAGHEHIFLGEFVEIATTTPREGQ